jgi:hypothetical protein
VLAYLKNNGGRSNLRTLSEQIAGWENDTDPALISSKQRMRVYTALRQSHLPKMDRHDILEFDEQSGDVQLTSAADTVEEYMESTDDNSIDVRVFSLGIGGLGLLLSVGFYLDVFLTAGIPDAVAGGMISLLIVLVGLGQIYSRPAASDDSVPEPRG